MSQPLSSPPSSLSVQVKQAITQLRGSVDSLAPYFTNVKSIFGLILVLFALYQAWSTLPDKWTACQQAISTYAQQQQTLNNAQKQSQQLKKLSQELDKMPIIIAAVTPDKSAQIISLGVSQQVTKACDETQNKFLDIQPKASAPLAMDAVASLPAGITMAGGADPPPAATPAASGTNSGEASLGSLTGYQYHLTLQGTYAHLVAFIGHIAKLPTLVIINGIKLEGAKADTTKSPNQSNTPSDLVEMQLDFTVPLLSVAAGTSAQTPPATTAPINAASAGPSPAATASSAVVPAMPTPATKP